MSMDAVFKRSVYWMSDIIHGGTIWNMRKDIRQISYNIINGNRLQNERLSELLKWATDNSKFYKDYAGKSLLKFPVVNKIILLEHYGENCILKDKIPW